MPTGSGICIEQAIIIVELCRSRRRVTAKILKEEYENHGIFKTLRTCQRHLSIAESHLPIDEWRERC